MYPSVAQRRCDVIQYVGVARCMLEFEFREVEAAGRVLLALDRRDPRAIEVEFPARSAVPRSRNGVHATPTRDAEQLAFALAVRDAVEALLHRARRQLGGLGRHRLRQRLVDFLAHEEITLLGSARFEVQRAATFTPAAAVRPARTQNVKVRRVEVGVDVGLRIDLRTDKAEVAKGRQGFFDLLGSPDEELGFNFGHVSAPSGQRHFLARNYRTRAECGQSRARSRIRGQAPRPTGTRSG